jgi:hypothetical protein
MEDFLADLDKELSGNDTVDNSAKSVEIKKDFLRNNGKPKTTNKNTRPQNKNIQNSQAKTSRVQ